MDLQVEYWARSIDEWESLWSHRPGKASPTQSFHFGYPSALDSFNQASRSIARVMRSRGFRSYRNGGMPLLERWAGPWRQEILLRPGPASIRGSYIPLEVQVHVSHAEVGEMRSRYLIADSIASSALASGNIGELDSPSGWVLWNMAEPLALEMVQESLQRLALPWLSLLSDAEALDVLLGGHVRLVDPLSTFEWIAVMYGGNAAVHYLESFVLTDDAKKEEFDLTISRLQYMRGRAPYTSSLIQRLAIAAWSLNLLPGQYLWAV